MILDIQFAEIQRIGGATEDELNAKISELIASNNALQSENKNLKTQNDDLTDSNEILRGEKSALEADLEELQASIKPEQEKTVDIAENGTTEITPDENKTLSKVTVKVNVPASGDTAELENLIDESGVLDSTDGTATEKVKGLVSRAQLLDCATTFKFNPDTIPERIEFYLENELVQCSEMFRDCKRLKYMVGINTSKAITVKRMFHSTGLETIVEPLDFSSVTSVSNSVAFGNAISLRDVRFVPNSIKYDETFPSMYLSDESIQSIIDGLAYSEENPTLTVHSDVYGRLTDEQWTTLFDKCWNIV